MHYHHADTEHCSVIVCNVVRGLIIAMRDECSEHLRAISKTKTLQTFRILSQSLFSFGNTLNFCVTAESPYTFLIPEALQIRMIVMSMDSFRCTFWSAQKYCYSLGIEFCTQWFRDFRGIYAWSLLGRGSASPLGFLERRGDI